MNILFCYYKLKREKDTFTNTYIYKDIPLQVLKKKKMIQIRL